MILGLDLETTGLTAGEDRVIEICCGVYDNEFRRVKNVTMRFNPCKAIDPKAQAVHHISNADLMNEPKFEERASLLSQLLCKADMIVIHNAKFDAPFLKAELERCGVTVPTVSVYDTMAESRWATPDGKWPKLGELCYALNVNYNPDEAHAAEYDVDKMMECFGAMVKLDRISTNVVPFNEIEPFKRRR